MSCISGIIISALTLALVIVDLSNNRMNNLVDHIVLGGIVIMLFFTMCNYGYELVNWIFLGFIPLMLIISWIASFFKVKIENSTCDVCHETNCECERPRYNISRPEPIKPDYNLSLPTFSYKKPLSCPANPGGITLPTKCGVSRYT
jgi:hypothetical protein